MQDRPEKTGPRTLRLNNRDNLIVAIDPVDKGTSVQGVAATQRIMRGHKMAVEPIAKGQPVLKFGQIIGFASEDIAPGAHIHTHNCSRSPSSSATMRSLRTRVTSRCCRPPSGPRSRATAAATARPARATTSACSPA